MSGVLGGSTALAAVIAVGWGVGRAGLLGVEAPGILSRLSFYVATPALLFLTLAEADATAVLSRALTASAGSAVLAGSPTGSWRSLVAQPLRTPVVLGCGLGLLLAASGLELPALVLEPVELVAALALG